jgi:nucleotide-binding universal stress UspA family protein
MAHDGEEDDESAHKISKTGAPEGDSRRFHYAQEYAVCPHHKQFQSGPSRRGAESPNKLVCPERQEQCGVNAPSRMSGPAKKILLATDLSARCDRALYRAAMLAKHWQSSLIVLHVVEHLDLNIPGTAGQPSWRGPPDPRDIARKHLLADVDALPARPTLRIAEGNPVEAILCIADAENCDLIAIGVGRDNSLGHFILGRTADRLFRRSRVPLLVVKDRPRRPYENIVFATDLSDSSRYALETTARFFSGQRLTIFHAYRPPPLITESALHPRYRMEVEHEVRAFLAGMDKSAPGWQQPHVLIEDGAPNMLLRDYVRDKEVDLIVLGAHGRSALVEIFLGSVAKAIIDDVRCDALVIREPRAAVET